MGYSKPPGRPVNQTMLSVCVARSEIFDLGPEESSSESDHEELEADMPEKYTVSLSYASPRVVHTALGRPDSPIPQGMDEEQSLINLKFWVEGVVVGEAGAGVVRGAGGADYSGMDTSQYHRIVIGLSQFKRENWPSLGSWLFYNNQPGQRG